MAVSILCNHACLKGLTIVAIYHIGSGFDIGSLSDVSFSYNIWLYGHRVIKHNNNKEIKGILWSYNEKKDTEVHCDG